MTQRTKTTRYATAPDGTRLSFHLDGDVVWVYTKTANLGGYNVSRYGACLNSAWIRAFMAANFPA